MSKLQPYKYWTREELYLHCTKQVGPYNFSILEMKEVIYDKRWDPVKEFNGCTLVQDPLHPFWPCVRHDYDWVVGNGGIEADRRFYNNLKQAGMLSFKARMWFIGVRLGWVLWYKWK
jgi:hypothetical protein